MQLQISLVSLLDIFDRKRAQIVAQMPQIKSNEVWEVEMTAAFNEDKGEEEAVTDDPCTRLAWRRFTLMCREAAAGGRQSQDDTRQTLVDPTSRTPALGGGFKKQEH